MDGCKARIAIGFIEILENDIRFRNDSLAVDERRHYCTSIELAIPRLLVLPCAQDEMAAFPVEALLGKTHPYLLGAKRHIVVVKHQHWFLSVLCLFKALGSASTPRHRCGRRRLRA